MYNACVQDACGVTYQLVRPPRRPQNGLKPRTPTKSSHRERIAQFRKKAARRLIDQLSEIALGELFDLECVEVLDSPNIRYFVDAKTSRPLAELSTGQKGTVVIALNMIEGEGPLVIDHPEDPLDTESIYSQIVARFRESKDKRQFLVTTHNANVAVGADAELSHVLEATAKKGSVVASGSIDHQKTNDLLLLHLEGGGDALTMRVRKYGLDKE